MGSLRICSLSALNGFSGPRQTCADLEKTRAVWYYWAMRLIPALGAVLIAAPVLAADVWPVAKFNGWSGPKPQTPCECRHKSGKAMLGEKVCMRQGSQMVTMECTKVLNNTTWRKVGEGCEFAGLPLSLPVN